MSSRGRGNKRNNCWNGQEREVKRFYGTKKHQSSVSQPEFSAFYRSSKYPRQPYNRHNFNKYHMSTRDTYFQQPFHYTHPSVCTLPSKEKEDSIQLGPGSETERLEKVLAAKRRIEEALAAKSSNDNNQEITFQNSLKESVQTNTEQSLNTRLPVASLDLSLTNSDFKEIGSVESGVVVEGEIEGSEPTPNVVSHSSQQRSFGNTDPFTVASTSKTAQPSRVGGWSMSAINEIANTEPVRSINTRPLGEIFFQESREKILGNLTPEDQNDESSFPKPTSCSPKPQSRNDISRVGRLYQSFLKSRLFGYTLKVKDKVSKSAGSNPLLDKSVLGREIENETYIQHDKILELQNPFPTNVKMEDDTAGSAVETTTKITAEEAMEFCKEFSYLLTYPNFLIPPENLEQLGLGHLHEMNKLIDGRRNNDRLESLSESQDSFLRVRSVNALNKVTENELTFDNDRFPSHIPSNLQENVVPVNLGKEYISDNGSQQQCSNLTSVQNNSALLSEELDLNALNNENTTATVSEVPNSSGQNTLFKSVVEKVVEQLLSTPNIVSRNTPSSDQPGLSQSEMPYPHVSSSETISSIQPTLNQIQVISSKILKMFLIDKQIEELRIEKNKMYKELLSVTEISSTLFNSWAEDQIQQGKVMTVVTNSSITVPELSRVINQEGNLPVHSTSQPYYLNSLNETVSELVSVKKEYADPKASKLQNMKVEPCLLSNLVEVPDASNALMANQSNYHDNKPKLSVRKDLLDPKVNTILSDNGSSELLSEVQPKNNKRKQQPGISKGMHGISLNPKKKKKTIKKKSSVMEFVNLVDDTTDEESCDISIGSSLTGNDPLCPDGSSLVETSDKITEEQSQKGKVKNKENKMRFSLHNNTATCMTTLKRALIVGCKDGLLMVFSAENGNQECVSQIHNDSIVCMHLINKCVITGSSDSTIGLFSLENQCKIQTIKVYSPVQCCDVRFKRVFIGTKSGFLSTLKINIQNFSKEETVDGSLPISLEFEQTPLKLTESSILAVKAAKEGARKIVIIASRGEQITVRDSVSGLLLRTFTWCDTVHCLQLYGETPLVFCGTNTKSVKVVNFITGENTNDCLVGRAVVQIMFQQSIMFAACYDGKIYMYDVENKRLITSVNICQGLILCMTVHKQQIIVANNREKVQAIPFPRELRNYLKINNKTDSI